MRLDRALKDGTNHIEECILLRFRKPKFGGRFSGWPTVPVLVRCPGLSERPGVKMDTNSVWNTLPLTDPHNKLLSSPEPSHQGSSLSEAISCSPSVFGEDFFSFSFAPMLSLLTALQILSRKPYVLH